jgi:nucleoside-diphosphate-sugar epimerase
MKVAVTGAAGLTGGAVVEALADRGHDVRGITRRKGEAHGMVASVVADVEDPHAMERALLGVEALVHVAGVHLGETLARQAAVRELRRLVVISTAGIYSAHRSSVGVYARNEAALRAVHPDVVFVRPTMIYGSARDRNVHHVIRFALRWRFLPVPGEGSMLIQPIHYRDLAAVAAELVASGATGVVDAGGARPVTLRDAARATFAALERPARLVTVPLGPSLMAASVLDALRGSRWRERVERTLEDRSVDNARLLALTRVRPREFEAGLRDEVRELRGG